MHRAGCIWESTALAVVINHREELIADLLGELLIARDVRIIEISDFSTWGNRMLTRNLSTLVAPRAALTGNRAYKKLLANWLPQVQPGFCSSTFELLFHSHCGHTVAETANGKTHRHPSPKGGAARETVARTRIYLNKTWLQNGLISLSFAGH